MPIPTVVELRSAFHWFCEACGRTNFSLPAKMEFAPGEKAGIFREVQGLDDDTPLPDGWEAFEMMEMPERVKCEVCGAEFDTMPDEGPEDFQWE